MCAKVHLSEDLRFMLSKMLPELGANIFALEFLCTFRYFFLYLDLDSSIVKEAQNNGNCVYPINK